MNTTLTMNKIGIIKDMKDMFSGLSVFGYSDYKNNSEEVYEKDALLDELKLDELKNDIGDDLFYALSDEDKQFILDTEGSIDFGYKLDNEGIKRIEKSLREDYEY